MRSIWRTIDPAVLRDIALLCLADALVGVSFGAITVSSGLPVWLPSLMSVVVFAGAAQFLAVGMLAAGAGPLAAVVAGLLVNARHLPFGFAVADAMGPGRWRRLLGSHLVTDESVAFTMAQHDPDRRRAVFWTSAVGLWVCWNLGALLGAVAGRSMTDTAALGLDAAFPAVLLALVMPALRRAGTRRAALAGAVVAVAATPVLPAGLPVLLSTVALPLSLGRSPRRAEPAP